VVADVPPGALAIENPAFQRECQPLGSSGIPGNSQTMLTLGLIPGWYRQCFGQAFDLRRSERRVRIDTQEPVLNVFGWLVAPLTWAGARSAELPAEALDPERAR
jgi:hypothetical protein